MSDITIRPLQIGGLGLNAFVLESKSLKEGGRSEGAAMFGKCFKVLEEEKTLTIRVLCFVFID